MPYVLYSPIDHGEREREKKVFISSCVRVGTRCVCVQQQSSLQTKKRGTKREREREGNSRERYGFTGTPPPLCGGIDRDPRAAPSTFSLTLSLSLFACVLCVIITQVKVNGAVGCCYTLLECCFISIRHPFPKSPPTGLVAVKREGTDLCCSRPT